VFNKDIFTDISNKSIRNRLPTNNINGARNFKNLDILESKAFLNRHTYFKSRGSVYTPCTIYYIKKPCTKQWA